jgi:hypothetical protein
MNERIKELAQKCWDRRLDGVHFDIEMFAELIVRECCPKRQWVGLTPEEVKEISFANRPYVVDMVVALEAKLKEKNV